ncbi:MAG: glycine cleavage system aminomethyltransferase GcvT [Verrucomicrobiota bacterium]|nr:glycine cleavage system aminomethyltransferase GcvT [Verrucomicrobiota bacterium]
MTDGRIRRTPLYETHLRAGARIVPFAGWEMPVQYAGIIQEHTAVRGKAGLFDISHMGEFIVRGPESLPWLNSLLTNDLNKLKDGEGQYTILCNEQGGVIDDLYVYRLNDAEFFLVVNASMIEKDFDWLERHKKEGITLENQSDKTGALALQGPGTLEIMTTLGLTELPKKHCIVSFTLGGIPVRLSRTGYTGEDGVEIFFPAAHSVKLWETLLSTGDVIPCGLGARDTLRLEMCYPLNGNDLSPKLTPLEAGLGYFVSLDKGEFMGRDKMVEQKEKGVPVRLIAFKQSGPGAPPRAHYKVFANGAEVGEVTSGTMSPTLKTGIGLAYIKADTARIGQALEIEVRGQRVAAIIEKKPFLKK